MSTNIAISGILINQVQLLYNQALKFLSTDVGVREGINGYTQHAIPAYILCVASVEAFVNESFISPWGKMLSKDSPLWKLSKDFINNMEIRNKIILFPELLFNKSFSRNNQPFQDIDTLIRIRNIFTHYKMRKEPEKIIKSLEEKGVLLKAKNNPDNVDFDWATKLLSSEGIRWAHNVACSVIKALAKLAPEDRLKSDPFLSSSVHFNPIPDSYPKTELIRMGVDLEDTNR